MPLEGAPGRPGSVPERPGSALGASWKSSGSAPDRPKIVWERFRNVPAASLEYPESPQVAPEVPGSIFHRCFIDLGSIFDQFCVDFCPRCPATQTQNQTLQKDSCDPRRMSWLLRCAVASSYSYVFLNNFRALHVRLLFVADPQAHLLFI